MSKLLALFVTTGALDSFEKISSDKSQRSNSGGRYGQYLENQLFQCERYGNFSLENQSS